MTMLRCIKWHHMEGKGLLALFRALQHFSLVLVVSWLLSSGTVLAQDSSRQLMGLRGGTDSASLSSPGQQQVVKSTADFPLPVTNITVPLFSHSGTHHVHVYVGSPPQRQTLIVDTGSKAMAFPCKTCKTCGSCCGSHASPYFDPSLSTTHRVAKCGSCLLEGVAQCSLFGNYCTFSQKYTEGSAWTATEVEDVVWLGSANVVESLETYMHRLAVAYPFGCQTTSRGLFRKQYADGILGVSIHETSLVTALHSEGLIPSDAFSLCITREGGHLSLGGTLTPKILSFGRNAEHTHQSRSWLLQCPSHQCCHWRDGDPEF